MNREVHYEMTRRWALEAGFSEEGSETISAADWNVDAIHDVHVWANKGYHFSWLGANRRARRLFAEAVEHGDLVALGEALHCRQDAIGHGFWGHIVHWEGIDRWERRGQKVRDRIESSSRGLLAEYLRRRPVSALSQAADIMEQRVDLRVGSRAVSASHPGTAP